jgi:hypothetical protein
VAADGMHVLLLDLVAEERLDAESRFGGLALLGKDAPKVIGNAAADFLYRQPCRPTPPPRR